MPRLFKQYKSGFTLLEVIVALGGLSVLFLVVLAMFNVVKMQRNTEARALAQQILQEEAEALRSASFADLGVRTATPFIEVAYNSGPWRTDNPVGAHTVPNTLQVDATGGASAIVVPTGSVTDGTYETYFRVRTGSPAGWKFGMYLHYHDDQNNYLLQGSATGFTFYKTVEGTQSALPWTAAVGITPGTWYKLAILAAGPSYTVKLNDIVLNASAMVDDTFASGHWLLAASDGASIDFDTVRFDNTLALAWNFDTATETVGHYPLGWNRPSPDDLADGTTSVTIEEPEAGFSDLKRVTLAVTWTERGAMRTLTNQFDINQYSVLP